MAPSIFSEEPGGRGGPGSRPGQTLMLTGAAAGERTTVSLSRWSSGAGRAHAGVVSVLTPAEVLIAARRLAGARPHLAAVAGIVHREDLWQLCREELDNTGIDVRVDGWDIRGRWFGVVVGATPRPGELRRGETIPWRVIAAQLARRERPRLALIRGSPALTDGAQPHCSPARL